MNFLRKHWYDLGGFLSIVTLVYIVINRHNLTNYQLVLWLSLVTLFFHQLEEYRIVGTFPGMVNKVIYHSEMPDRYPLNANTAFYVNAVLGWTSYFLAAVLAEKAVWLGIATILVSSGKVIAHTVLFNIKGKTVYNAGMLTSWLLFVPCVCYFFFTIQSVHLAAMTDYLIGVPLGIIINVVGILKLIDWLADKDTNYIFEQRNLLPRDRKKNNR